MAQHNSLPAAAAKMLKYHDDQASAFTLGYEGVLHSFANLTGLANPTTGLLKSGTAINFFSTPQGARGLGWDPITAVGTTHTGGTNEMPGGKEFCAEQFGFYIDPQLPDHISNILARASFLTQFKGPLQVQLGNIVNWPCANLGPQSPSAATAVPNQVITYQRNGSSPATVFSDGGEMIFLSKQPIKFILSIEEDIYLTANGEPIGDNNPLLDYPAIAGVWMYGAFFELSQT